MNTPSFWVTFGPLFAMNGLVIVLLVVFAFVEKNQPRHTEVEDRHSSIILNKWIRRFWMWLTNPLFKIFLFLKLSPNNLSFLGTIFATLSGVAIAFGQIGWGGWLMVLGASFDFFDGRMARLTNSRTESGAFFDSSMDRYSEGLTLIGVCYVYRNTWFFWVVMLAYLGSMLTSYTKAKGESMGVDYSGGMMQRPERLAYLGAGAILTPIITYALYPIISEYFSWTYQTAQLWVYAVPLGFVTVMCNLASINRVVNIMKLLNKKEFGDSSQ